MKYFSCVISSFRTLFTSIFWLYVHVVVLCYLKFVTKWCHLYLRAQRASTIRQNIGQLIGVFVVIRNDELKCEKQSHRHWGVKKHLPLTIYVLWCSRKKNAQQMDCWKQPTHQKRLYTRKMPKGLKITPQLVKYHLLLCSFEIVYVAISQYISQNNSLPRSEELRDRQRNCIVRILTKKPMNKNETPIHSIGNLSDQNQ